MIEKSIWLRCPPAQAFELFTSGVSDWWPKTHRPSKDPGSELFLERSGRFWERARDGREIELGRVLEWEPPHRLAPDFYIGTSADRPTAMEATFIAENGGTRVKIHHRAKPESEEAWSQRAPVYERAWDAVLEALASR